MPTDASTEAAVGTAFYVASVSGIFIVFLRSGLEKD